MTFRSAVLAGTLAVALMPAIALAQQDRNPFQGFSSSSGDPIDIKSTDLEVRQNEQKAIFSGDVIARQGKSELRAGKLTIFYAQAAASGENSISRIEVSGGVTVISEDQSATGAAGVFDMKADTARLTGDVVLTQGPNVLKGSELVVNMKTGVAKIIGGTSGLFVPGSNRPSTN